MFLWMQALNKKKTKINKKCDVFVDIELQTSMLPCSYFFMNKLNCLSVLFISNSEIFNHWCKVMLYS